MAPSITPILAKIKDWNQPKIGSRARDTIPPGIGGITIAKKRQEIKKSGAIIGWFSTKRVS